MNGTGKPMTMKTFWIFIAIAFAQCWGLATTALVFQDQLEPIFGPIGYTNPLFMLAVYAPAFAGIGLVIRHYGIRGLGQYLKRLTMVRMPARWWAFLLLGIPAVFFAGAAIKGSLDTAFNFPTVSAALLAILTAAAIGPMEEFGWRGVALPILQERFSPFVASLILGGFWGLWHTPAFFLSGTPQSGWSYGPYLLGVMAIAIILTPMFNAAKGSLLIPMLYHLMMNSPLWPDAQPYDSYLFAIVAVVVVILNRKTMFTKGAGVSEVLAPAAEEAAKPASHHSKPATRPLMAAAATDHHVTLRVPR
jgi:membrane protease YdiL (CAAX protease family)